MQEVILGDVLEVHPYGRPPVSKRSDHKVANEGMTFENSKDVTIFAFRYPCINQCDCLTRRQGRLTTGVNGSRAILCPKNLCDRRIEVDDIGNSVGRSHRVEMSSRVCISCEEIG